MLNPYIGVLLNGKYFGYDTSSFRESLKLRNEVFEAQSNRTASVLGKTKETFALTISLDNTYNVYAGTYVGSTTWAGVSRLADFKSFIGAGGASMPIIFVSPYGVTYSVVPTGSLDINIFNPENPKDDANGTEFRISLTLEVLA
jgi:hypothetical protein